MMRDFQRPGRSAVFASNGMCATSHPLAAKTAIRVLESGGNAVDAAIAAGILLGLCEPQMTGLGGDCFVLLKPAGEDRIVALNGSGRAPATLSADALRQGGAAAIAPDSVESITLPGAVDAFCRLSTDWGRLGLPELLAPAIRYAEEGVPVAPRTASDWAESANRLVGTARDVYLPSGAPPRPGTLFRLPAQAEVLRRIAQHGRTGFYEGEVADDMVTSLRALGGSHSHEDFAHTRCDYTDPIRGTYGGIELVEHAPNGQGATALLMLNILAQFDLGALDPLGAERAHLEAEAAKLAYDARDRFLADADYTTRLDHMLSMDTAQALAALIDPKTASASPARRAEAVHRDTVYLTVVDRDRMAVSLIYSIFWAFGSGHASSRFGVLFQNRGAGFTLEQGHPNEAGGGKRPMHTIIPAMVQRNGHLEMPFGVMGGAYQPAGHARFVTNIETFGMDLQEAINAPRSFAGPDGLVVERGYEDGVRQRLTEMGHDTVMTAAPLGGAQAIRIDRETGVLEGASDPRKDGCALGY